MNAQENHDGLSCEELAQRKIDERENNMVADILKRRIVARCPSCKVNFLKIRLRRNSEFQRRINCNLFMADTCAKERRM